MTRLFETTDINGMSLPNRFMRSATWEGMATEDGEATPQLTAAMEKIVEGGVGLIISSFSYVRTDGQVARRQLGIYKDELIPALNRMTEAVHKQSGKIVMQIMHGGVFAKPELTSQIPIGPSEVQGLANLSGKEMAVGDIQNIIDAFGNAARRVKEAGFDGIQIFAGHGYLLNQFLSPFFNKRADHYGGNLEGRARIVLEVMKNVRTIVGEQYPVLIKMNSEDFLEGGLTVHESLSFGTMLYHAGVDAIELSGGTWISGNNIPARKEITRREKEAYFQEAARVFKRKIDVPLILVGGIRSFDVADMLVEEGLADYVSMCRPLIREPGLINRWKAGDLAKSACLSCNQCFEPARSGEGIYCVVEKKIREKTAGREKG
ncbi:MAG: NADH:flavin oxidoreductase [Deltaproteobacteria bacterium]|nr:NADH:flavin oxidoreductase [Deltaproteobacteria bacterium]